MHRFLFVPALLALCGLAQAQSCGDTLLHDTTLAADLHCTSGGLDALVVGASGAVREDPRVRCAYPGYEKRPESPLHPPRYNSESTDTV